jgi:DNA-binding transcriptional MerR regulator
MNRKEHDRPVFLTTAELAHRWRMSPRTLEGWRDKGIGVSYRRIGNSRILYALDDVEEFERRWRMGEVN